MKIMMVTMPYRYVQDGEDDTCAWSVSAVLHDGTSEGAREALRAHIDRVLGSTVFSSTHWKMNMRCEYSSELKDKVVGGLVDMTLNTHPLETQYPIETDQFDEPEDISLSFEGGFKYGLDDIMEAAREILAIS